MFVIFTYVEYLKPFSQRKRKCITDICDQIYIKAK